MSVEIVDANHPWLPHEMWQYLPAGAQNLTLALLKAGWESSLSRNGLFLKQISPDIQPGTRIIIKSGINTPASVAILPPVRDDLSTRNRFLQNVEQIQYNPSKNALVIKQSKLEATKIHLSTGWIIPAPTP